MVKDLVVPQGIKALRATQDVSPEPTSEQVYVFSSSQLQDLISHAISEATKPLNESLEALQEWQKETELRLDKHSEWISDLKYGKSAGAHGKKSDERKKRLSGILVARKNAGLTYSEVGKILELGTRQGTKNTREQNMTHFGKVLESANKEFVVTPSKTSGGKLVKLTSTYYSHLTKPKED